MNEGLAVLSHITLPWNQFNRNLRSQYPNSLTKPLAKLELTKTASQTRGRWKKGAKRDTGDVSLQKGGDLLMPLGLAGLWSDPCYTLGKANLGFGRAFLGVKLNLVVQRNAPGEVYFLPVLIVSFY